MDHQNFKLRGRWLVRIFTNEWTYSCCIRKHIHTCTSYAYLNYRINRTRLLTEPTVDALGHIDVVPRGSPAAIRPGLGFNGNCLSRTHGLTELASNAPLFSVGVPSEDVLTTESWTDGTFLEGIIECSGLSEEGTPSNGHT